MDIIVTTSKEYYMELIERYIAETHQKSDDVKCMAGILAKSPVFITDWKVEDYNRCIKAHGSKSQANIYKYTCYIEPFYKWCCQEYGVSPKRMYLYNGNGWYIDEKGLIAITISHEDYKRIRRLLVEHDYKGTEVNTRNKLIFELAWETLTAEEIRDLKYSDVNFTNSYCRLELPSREIYIKDGVVIRDLMETLEQGRYYRAHPSWPRGSYVDYIDSPQVIRAVRTNAVDDPEAKMVNPFQVVKKRLIEVAQGILPHVNMEDMSIEAIRRSRMVYEFQQHPTLTPQEMAKMLGRTTCTDLYGWMDFAYRLTKKQAS